MTKSTLVQTTLGGQMISISRSLYTKNYYEIMRNKGQELRDDHHCCNNCDASVDQDNMDRTRVFGLKR